MTATEYYEQYKINSADDFFTLQTDLIERFGIEGRLEPGGYTVQGTTIKVGNTVVWNRNEHGGWSLDVING